MLGDRNDIAGRIMPSMRNPALFELRCTQGIEMTGHTSFGHSTTKATYRPSVPDSDADDFAGKPTHKPTHNHILLTHILAGALPTRERACAFATLQVAGRTTGSLLEVVSWLWQYELEACRKDIRFIRNTTLPITRVFCRGPTLSSNSAQ